ncbi:hypothetical protein GCM10023322_72610 [Rugosimonospora acidiphila]|uniref:Uncharacterized protein n=1 Tax=Rugosimonospora acidiphila TaxID=556531 RepID=A0ABP9SMJ5_9ACTN
MQAEYVSQRQFQVFHERLRLAEDCLQDVARRDPGAAAVRASETARPGQGRSSRATSAGSASRWRIR